MSHSDNNTPFPEQNGPDKLHGPDDASAKREKYLRDGGKIEDYPENDGETAKMSSNPKQESSHLTDRSGEEKKEDYINTDERQKDLNRKRN